MEKRITADLIITNDGRPLTDHAVITRDGVIEDIRPLSEVDDVERHTGVITPGFVNAHCHLELSHLKGAISTGTGLIPFIKGVVTLRDYPQEEIDAAIIAADQEMRTNGIVAVGDISNQLDTAAVKADSPIRYYTFVEMFDMLQEDQAQETYDRYRAVYDAQSDHGHNQKSCVPHAPYSVSKGLFAHINDANQEVKTISIHNQELAAENELFMSKSGQFLDFYAMIGVSLEAFEPTGTSSLEYALSHMDPRHRTLLVHNTQCTPEDIAHAHGWSDKVYWATCSNANLYIENRLPNYQHFVDGGAKVCIGTDSLSSNWQLCILSEMRTIKRYQSYLCDLDIIRWATLHGAQALGYDDLGKLIVGTSPGINLIDVDVEADGSFDLSLAGRVKRLV